MSSRTHLVGLLLSLVVSCGPGRTTFARYPGGTAAFDRTQDSMAIAVADHAIAAAGGLPAWQSAKQLRWSQSITQDGKVVIEGEQAWDRWNGRHHARAKHGKQGDIVVMRDLYEDKSWVFMDPGEGHRMKRIAGGSDEATAAAKERWEFDTAILFMPFLLEEPGTKLTYVGEQDTDDGKKVDVLKVMFDPADHTRGATYQIAVGKDGLVSRIEIQKPGKSENEMLGYSVTKWMDGGGIKVPATIENLGLKGEVVTFAGLTIGAPDDTLFEPPL
jgi:hypothetical protein